MAEKQEVDFVLLSDIDGNFRKISQVSREDEVNLHIVVMSILNLIVMDGENREMPQIGLKTVLDSISHQDMDFVNDIYETISNMISLAINHTVSVEGEYDETTEILKLTFDLGNLPGKLVVDTRRTMGTTTVLKSTYFE